MILHSFKWTRIAAISLVAILALAGAGCRYSQNRAYDLADIGSAGIGVTAEKPEKGFFPPMIGAHVNVTEMLNLGALNFAGWVAEWDGRGFFVGHERRSRLGLGPMQMMNLDQDYENGWENYFKKTGTAWSLRMMDEGMAFRNTPAKELNYSFWSDTFYVGRPLFYRGWQYWGHSAAEIALGDPLTHLGFTLRVGLDFSEVTDFLLGFVCIDYRGDDLSKAEYKEKRETGPHTSHETAPKPSTEERDREAAGI